MIEVLQPGLFTTVQDLGRVGYQAFGVPVAGAMDAYAASCANLLVGNEENTALLELTMQGGSYIFTRDTLIAITGAQMSAQIAGKPVVNWQSHLIRAGEQLSFSCATEGCRSYLAVAGGIQVEQVMGSASTHTRSKLGGLQGRALQAGDLLPLGVCSRVQVKKLPEHLRPTADSLPVIRILPGPQDKAFRAEALEVLQQDVYEIQADSDRMGYRLAGAKLEHITSADIISDALFAGAVQVPGSGQPIIMLADCQTTGGYTKLCFVITPDLPVLAQCKPGDKIKFQVVDDEQAVQAYKEYQGKLAQVRSALHSECKEFIVTVNGIKYAVQMQA